MLFMNLWDIDDACNRSHDSSVMTAAVRLLRDVRDLADSVSDGWAY